MTVRFGKKARRVKNADGKTYRQALPGERGQKCPEAGRTIYLQQDGASPHTANGNARYFKRWGGNADSGRYEKGFVIEVVTQPARSPDLNICDLCVFRMMKSGVRQTAIVIGGLDGLMDIIKGEWRR